MPYGRLHQALFGGVLGKKLLDATTWACACNRLLLLVKCLEFHKIQVVQQGTEIGAD
jgi:hypothetical protein